MLAVGHGHRSPLVDDEDMAQHPGPSMPVTARPPSAYLDNSIGSSGTHAKQEENAPYDPYVGYSYNNSNQYGLGGAGTGYVAARTSSPPPASHNTDSIGHYRRPSTGGSAEGGQHSGQHSRSYSFSSYEPLLAAAGINQKTTPPGTPGPGGPQPPTPPPRSPMRPPLAVTQPVRDGAASRQSTSTDDLPRNVADDRLNPALSAQLNRADTNASRIRDDQDYSRPVLGVSTSS